MKERFTIINDVFASLIEAYSLKGVRQNDMDYDKEYFQRKLSESKERFAALTPDEKLKYLATAERMSAKARSEVLVNLGLGEEFFFFYGAQSPFSQWYECSFIVDRIRFTCAEQYMMYKKAIFFDDDKIASEIANSGYSPKENRELGRKLQNFDEVQWNEHKTTIVWHGNYNKFYQNKQLLKVLIETAPKILVEASPSDLVWGIGLSMDDPKRFDQANWRGDNLLGYILTSLREVFRMQGG